MCIEVDNCFPGIGTNAGSYIASGFGLVIGGVTLCGFSVDLQALVKQDPIPDNYENLVILNATALVISGLYVLSSLCLAFAVNSRSTCGMCIWVVMTVMEIGVLIYGAIQNQTMALYIALAVLGCIMLGFFMVVVCSQCRKVSRNRNQNSYTQFM